MATDKALFLSQSDAEILREVIEWRRRYRDPPLRRQPISEENAAPDVYIARTPATGISPISSDAGTGTGTWDDEYYPHFGNCSIYKLSQNTAGVKILQAIGLNKRVYNISSVPIPGSTWAIVERDKFGTWIAVTHEGQIDESPTTGTGNGDSGDTGTGATGTGDTGTGTTSCTAITLSEEQVRCEDNALNVYTRTIDLNIVAGCLVKSTGSWVFDRNEGSCGVNVVQYVNVENIYESEYLTENTIYFNEYNQTLNILISNVWYTYCACDSTTGTGFAEQTYWYCLEEPAALEACEDCLDENCLVGNCPCDCDFVLTASGFTNGTCVVCDELNGTHYLNKAQDGTCVWETWETQTICNNSGAFPPLPYWSLSCGGDDSSTWILSARTWNNLKYELTSNSGILNCQGTNTFTLNTEGQVDLCTGAPTTVVLEAVCDTVQTLCCVDDRMPRTLSLTLTDGTGDCVCLNGETVEMEYNASTLKWEWSGTLCGEAASVNFECSGGSFGLVLTGPMSFESVSGAVTTCSPFLWSQTGLQTLNTGLCADSTVTVTVTE